MALTMRYNPIRLAAVASACLSFASTSTVHADAHFSTLQARQAADCLNLTAPQNSPCWDQLDITDYLTSWNVTTPVCSTSNAGDGSNCCVASEPWSTCFLRLATGSSGLDCTSLVNPFLIDSGSFFDDPCLPGPTSSTLPPDIAAKASYVVSSLASIYELFRNLADEDVWQGAAVSGLYTDLSAILAAKVVINNGNSNKAALAGLPFWGTSSVLAGGLPISTGSNALEFSSLAQYFTKSVQQTTGISSAWWGAPYDVNDTSYTGQYSQLPNLTSPLQSALTLIMSDVSVFNSFAAHGAYSISLGVVLYGGIEVALVAPLTTYVVSEALSQNKISASPMTTTTKEVFQQGRNCTSTGDICKDSSSTVYYWSSVTQRQYEISGSEKWVKPDGTNPGPVPPYDTEDASTFSLMNYIEYTEANLPVLFDGAYNCTLEGKAGGSAVNINADGSLDIACLSALPIYLAKGAPCPQGAVQVGGKCPFGYKS